jgi:TRAP-type C4-dicarboxylate transport system substrate-binding protein
MLGVVAGAVALAGVTATESAEAQDRGAPGLGRSENVLKMGSLAPEQSPWAQVLKVWQRAVKERTGEQLVIRFYWNGTQGDEASMVEKVSSGQLHGLVSTAVGLGKIHKPILALQMPGVFGSWGKLDQARNTLMDEFQTGANAKGFTILGWGDVGRMHWYSRGYAVTNPASLAGKKPYVWREDDNHRTLFRSIPGVTPVPLGVPEVLPALNANRVDTIHTPALTCGQLQWVSRFDHVVTDSHAFMVGALVMSKTAVDALPKDQQSVLIDTGKLAAGELTTRIRNEDNAALERQKKKLTPHDLTDAEKAEWMQLYQTVRQRLGQQGVYSPELIGKIERLGK